MRSLITTIWRSAPVAHCNSLFDIPKTSSSPYINQFLSADTIVPGYANPQALNRYSYVLGNPLNYIDPTGHSQCRTYEDCADMGTTPMDLGGETDMDDYGLEFDGDGTESDLEAFTEAIILEAERLYDACQGEASCEFSSPADLYLATHGITLITFFEHIRGWILL